MIAQKARRAQRRAKPIPDKPSLARKLWKRLQVAILLYGVGVSLYVLAFAALGERWAWIAFANNFLPWWALGGLVAGIIALGSRWRWPLLALQVPVIVAFVLLYGELLLPPEPATTPAGPRFTAVSFNIIGVQSDPAAIAATIRELDADIVGLQEVAPESSAWLKRELADMYPYQAHYPLPTVQGVALLSRYPIGEQRAFTPLRRSPLQLRAEVDVTGRPVAVYVIHLTPPGNKLLPVIYTTERRDRELAMLQSEYLAREEGPVIVLGDFNMTDLSTSYRTMAEQFNDAFRAAGRGFGFTFPAGYAFGAMPRLLRIDYVWYTDDLTALAARAGSDSGTSDHYPVIADLALNESTAAE